MVYMLSSTKQIYLHTGKIIIGQTTRSGLGHSSIQLNARHGPSSMVSPENIKTEELCLHRGPILAGRCM